MDNKEELKKEIQSIYSLLLARDKHCASTPFDKRATENIQTKQAFRNYIVFPVIIAALIIFIILVLYRPDFNSNIVQLAKYGLMVAYFIAIFLCLRKVYQDNPEIADFFQNPLTAFFDGLSDTVNHDANCVTGLQEYSEKALVFVKDRMEMQYAIILHRFGSMVGSLSKLGLLPGLLAVSIAVSDLAAQAFAYFLAVVFLVFYIASFWTQHSLPRINFYIQILDSELKRREQK